MTAADATAALRRAAAVGPYFAVDLDPGADPGWLPLGRLLDDAEVVAERVASVRTTLAERTGLDLGAIDLRACASIHLLGLASRLIAPALAAAVLGAVVPTVMPGDVRWRRVDGGPVPIAIAGPAVAAISVAGISVGSAERAAGALRAGVVDTLIAPMVRAFAASSGVAVSPQVLWGNVASAAAGAAGMLMRSGERFALDPTSVVTALLGAEPLAGTGGFGVDGRFFRRTSCCLFYRVPGGGTCGDCVLG